MARLRTLIPGEFINLGGVIDATGYSDEVRLTSDGSTAPTFLLARQQVSAIDDTLTNEEQTLTEGGAGLTSWTITFDGETTASLDDDVIAADVQTALEALPNIGAGNVSVTGGPLASGAFTVEFIGDLAETDVAEMTTTPTGGTGVVTVATAQAGGAAGAVSIVTTIEGSFDQSSWYTLATFTAVDEGDSAPVVENEVTTEGVLPPFIRALFTVTGVGNETIDLFVAAA